MTRAAEACSHLRHGQVTSIRQRDGRATGVKVNGAVVKGDAVFDSGTSDMVRALTTSAVPLAPNRD